MSAKLEPLYVVENLITKEVRILPYAEALQASNMMDTDPYYDVWYAAPNPDMKMYPVSELSPAAKILYGVAD